MNIDTLLYQIGKALRTNLRTHRNISIEDIEDKIEIVKNITFLLWSVCFVLTFKILW